MLELNTAIYKGEQSIIGTASDVDTRLNVGAALTDKDVTCEHELTVGTFYAKPFGFAVAAVLSRTNAFFMSEIL